MIEIQGTAILRDGENIGHIDGDTAFLPKKPGPAILGQIRKAAGKPDLAFEYVAARIAASITQSIAPVVPSGQTENNEGDSTSGKPVAGSSVTVAPQVSGKSNEVASPQTIRIPHSNTPLDCHLAMNYGHGVPATVAPSAMHVLGIQPAQEKTGMDRLLDLASEGKIPPPPKHNPAMGDKAPEFVAWFKRHATAEEIEAKYPATRRLPKPGDFEAAEHRRLNRKLDGEVEDKAD